MAFVALSGAGPTPFLPRGFGSGERFGGAVEAVSEQGVVGWALSLDDPDEVHDIEVRLDGTVLADGHTGWRRPDLDKVSGIETYCGFVVEWAAFIPSAAELLERSPGPIEVTVRGRQGRFQFVNALPTTAETARLLRHHRPHHGTPCCPETARLEGELARIDALIAEGRAPEAAGALLALLQAAEPEGMDALAVRSGRLLHQAHALFLLDRTGGIQAIYERLRLLRHLDALGQLRLLELALDAGDLDRACEHHAALLEGHGEPSDLWGRIAVSRFLQVAGRRAECLALLTSIAASNERNLAAQTVVLHRLIEIGGFDEARAHLDRLGVDPASPGASLLPLTFRLHLRSGQLEEVMALLKGSDPAPLPGWQLSEALFTVCKPGESITPLERRLSDDLYAILLTRGVDDFGCVQARIIYLLRNRRWDELEALFRAIEGTAIGTHRETQLRKLEFLCFANRVEDAHLLYRQVFAGTDLGKWEALTVIRLLAERKDWADIEPILLRHVDQGFDFGGAIHLAVQAVRKLGLHEKVLERPRRQGTAGTGNAELLRFFAIVEQDLGLRNAARAATPAPSLFESPQAVNTWLPHGPRPAVAGRRSALFLCTNRKYFFSVLTLLSSALSHGLESTASLHVFVDRDVPRPWHIALTQIASYFDVTLQVVEEQEFIATEVAYRSEYGIFTGGGTLARAAYFRIHAALYLLRHGDFDRLLYLDSDIVCRVPLASAFHYPLNGRSLAARTEDYSVEVKEAAAVHGLTPGQYFNSGVLIFDGRSASIAGRLTHALRLSEEEPEKLVFHDQCALNVAFAGDREELEANFNFFLRPHRERNGHIEDAAFLHYLDRPKPWDLTFDRPYREEWRVWALMVRAIIGRDLYAVISAASNEP